MRHVTRQHGSVFASAICERIVETELPGEAFAATGVIAWPDSPEDNTPSKQRYIELGNEIVHRAFDLAGPAIAAAFHAAARDVIERERQRRRKSRKT